MKTKVHVGITVSIVTDCATRQSAENGTRDDINLILVIKHISIYRYLPNIIHVLSIYPVTASLFSKVISII